jgi:hypothetical protein
MFSPSAGASICTTPNGSSPMLLRRWYRWKQYSLPKALAFQRGYLPSAICSSVPARVSLKQTVPERLTAIPD